MKSSTKLILERFFRNKIWIEKATRQSELAAFIKKLKPTPTPEGLKRFGPARDGGYLMPDDLEGVIACISPGVSLECGFDEEIASRGIDVIMTDASVEGPPSQNPRFRFMRKFVDITSTPQTVHINELCHLGALAHSSGDLILQMDIEGAEYRVLASMSDNLLKRFRIMVIEFHGLDQLFSRFAFSFIKPIFEMLTTHHRVVHIHPNNCSLTAKHASLSIPPTMEFTFYRNDRGATGSVRTLAYPHPLDADNVPSLPPIVLPDCWWR